MALGKKIRQVRIDSENNAQMVMPSLKSNSVDFRLKSEPVKPLPIELTHGEEKIFLHLRFEDEYEYLFNHCLKENDNEILKFICLFRQVQFLHVAKEFPDITENKIQKSLKRLLEYHLIDKWEYDYISPEGDSRVGATYFTRAAGDIYLQVNRLLNVKNVERWDKRLFASTDDQVIRFWKTTDVYQFMKHSNDYLEYHPSYICKEQIYKVTLHARKDPNTGKPMTKDRRVITRKARKFKLNGEVVMKVVNAGKNFFYSHVFYPIVTKEDINLLELLLIHWGLYNKDRQNKLANNNYITTKDNPRRFLTVICDNETIIEQIIAKYDLKSLKVDLVFLSLSDIENVKMDDSMTILNEDNPEVEFMRFNFNMIDLGGEE